jgi:hypothetical protein
MPLLSRIRESCFVSGGALTLALILSLAACDAAPAGDGSPFVLTTRGDFVRSNAPPGVEVTLGSKLIRPGGASDRLD